MSKSKEELNSLKEEVETLNNKLAELNEEELKQVLGGLFDETEFAIRGQEHGFWIPKLQYGSAMADGKDTPIQEGAIEVVPGRSLKVTRGRIVPANDNM